MMTLHNVFDGIQEEIQSVPSKSIAPVTCDLISTPPSEEQDDHGETSSPYEGQDEHGETRFDIGNLLRQTLTFAEYVANEKTFSSLIITCCKLLNFDWFLLLI